MSLFDMLLYKAISGGQVSVNAQTKTATPSGIQQTILPDDGYDYLSEVTVNAINSQTKIVTPSGTQQTVLPDDGYDYLSEVTVNAVPYTETLNSAGGYTVTIG